MPAIETFVQYYEKARYHLQAGKLRIAHGYLLKTIDLNPDFLDAYHLLGEVLRKLDRYGEATDIMTRLDKAVGFDPEVKLELARLEQAKNKYKRARRILLQILKRAPGHIESYCLLGDIYRAESNYKKAEEFYGKCLEIEPSHWGARRGINEMLRHPIENKTNGKNGVELESKKDLPVHSLEKRMAHAIEYLNEGKSGKALSLLRELEHKHPDHEMVALALAQALEAGGKIQEALKHLMGYLENQDQSAMIHFQCGHYCRTLKDLEQSREHFQKALEIDNDYYEAHLNWR